MRTPLKPRRLARITALGVLSVGAIALAQPEPVMEFRSLGLTDLESHPKDLAAHNALELLGERLAELGVELDLEPFQQTGINLLWEAVMGGVSMRMDVGEEGPGIAVAFSPSAEGGAARFAESLGRFFNEAGQPLGVDDEGAMVFMTPMGPARIMAAQGEHEAYTRVAVGPAGEIEPDVRRGELPADALPVFSGRLDLEGLGGFMLPLIARDDEEAARQIEQSGWLGEGAPTIEFAVGLTETHSLGRFRAINARAAYESVGGSTDTLGLQDFRVVPADATVVSGSNMSLEKIVVWIDQAAGEAGEDPLGQASEMLGVDVREDVLLNIGPQLMYYQSETTGGGGMLSAVVLAEIRDAEAFAAAQERVIEHLNQAAASEARGYVRVRHWSLGEGEAMSLTFPGLPIPLEPSWCLRGDLLVFAASPRGLTAAMEQLENPDRSVLDHPAFVSSVIEAWPAGGATALTFTDSDRLARKGYGMTNMLMSALANVSRSPASPDRVSGPLMPGYGEFTAGVQPYVEMGWWEDDDLVYTSSGDRSVLVQIATGAGMLTEMQGVAVPALMAGVLLPALGKARESATELKSSTQLRGVVQGLILYLGENDGSMPQSFAALIEEGFIPPEMLDSPFGPAPDGGPSIALRFEIDEELAYSFDSGVILAIDRSTLFNGDDQILVGFADNHVEVITWYELEEYLEMDVNEGAREELGIPEF